MTVTFRCVIDTNICIKLFVADLLTSKVNQLFTHLDDPSVEFFVPDLFYIVCANVLWKYVLVIVTFNPIVRIVNSTY